MLFFGKQKSTKVLQIFAFQKIASVIDAEASKGSSVPITDAIGPDCWTHYKDNGFSENIIHIINESNIPNNYYESLNIFYINKKRKRNIESINTNTSLTLKPLGRIKNEDKNNGKCGKHTKDDPDNIIKKCKRIFISYVIIHINSYTEKIKKYEPLLDLRYTYINNIKKIQIQNY